MEKLRINYSLSYYRIIFTSILSWQERRETITILKDYARMCASDLYEDSDKFYLLFDNLIQLFKKTDEGYDEVYLDDKTSLVHTTYWRWMGERTPEIRRKKLPPHLQAQK